MNCAAEFQDYQRLRFPDRKGIWAFRCRPWCLFPRCRNSFSVAGRTRRGWRFFARFRTSSPAFWQCEEAAPSCLWRPRVPTDRSRRTCCQSSKQAIVSYILCNRADPHSACIFRQLSLSSTLHSYGTSASYLSLFFGLVQHRSRQLL